MYYRKGTLRDIVGGFNRVVINGSPRLLVLNSIVWLLFAASCGLFGVGSGLLTFSVIALVLLGWATMEIVLAFFRHRAWKKAGVMLSLSHGTVFERVDHIFRGSSTSQVVPQIVKFTLPATGDKQEVAVVCATCQQTLVFRVVSQQKRQALRLRAAVIAVICLLGGLGLGIISAPLMGTQPNAAGGLLGGLVLLFCSGLATSWLLNYNGILLARAAVSPGILHRIRRPAVKTDFEELRRLAGTTLGAPTQQSTGSYHG